ncbi:MAG TPA: YdaU family protein [Burkholderiales bacterium]|nr:YdaU family protein [Burkholderiales bacterium]
MNFYKHYLGDYDGATAHLSWDEDMAYTRLLRAYYRREAPIPDAEKYRLARASTKAQRAAVDSVLGEFFQRDGDVWRNKRADEEIAAYLESEDGRAAKKENERERQRRHRERRKALFEALRVHGSVPSWDSTVDELQAMLDAVTQRGGNGAVTPPVTRDTTANQKPDTRSQIPEKAKSKASAQARATLLPDSFEVSERVKTWAASKGFGQLEKYLEFFAGRMKANGKRYTDWDEAFMNCIREDWPQFRKATAPDYSEVYAGLKD